MKKAVIVAVVALFIAGSVWQNAVRKKDQVRFHAEEAERQQAAKLADEKEQRQKEQGRLAEIQRRRDAIVNPIAEEYRPKFVAAAGQLKALTDTFPDPSTVHATWKSHADVGKMIADARGHVEEVDYSVLMQALGKPLPAGEVHLDSPLYIGWVPRLVAGVGNTLARSLASRDATEQEVRESFEHASQIRYLVVARPVSYVKPTIIVSKDKSKPNTFVPGEIVCVVYAIDLTKNSIMASFRMSAENSSKVEYEYLRGDSEVEAANHRLLRDLRDVTENAVISAAQGKDPLKF